LDRVIEEMRRMMLRSAAKNSTERMLNKGGPARTAGQQQQHQSSGAYGQLQGRFLDPSGFHIARELMRRSS
jgi:hypothetical protein